MQQKKKKKEFNDLLIPLIFTLSILPFVCRLTLYQSGLSKYTWYSDYDIISDFFSYSKSYCFILLSAVSLIILILYFLLYRSNLKEMRSFIPLGIYSFCLIIATVCSMDKHTSLIGGISHYESIFILFGYVILCIYAYQLVSKEHDFRIITNLLIVSLIFMCLIGFLQIIGKDPFTFRSVQKLIMPHQYWKDYLGSIQNRLSTHAISLTLSNPNYVSIYVSMFIPFFMVQLIYLEKKRTKLLLLGLLSALFILLVKTNARTGMISLMISILLLGYFYRTYLIQFWKPCVIIFAAAMILFLGLDSMNQFTFIKKFVATIESFQKNDTSNLLQEVETSKDNIRIRYQNKELYLSFSDATSNALKFKAGDGTDLSRYYDSKNKTLQVAPFDHLNFSIETSSGQKQIDAKLGRYTWRFCYENNQGYLYINGFEKRVPLEKIDTFGFRNHENLASGRGFIWSRSLPLTKKYFLAGSGPDTFALVFPQGDYVGKSNYCKTPYTLIEKPHNMYLMIAIQTGVPSLLAFLWFYGTYFVKSIGIYRKRSFHDYTERIGLGCLLATISYMISGFFNDSSLQTSPIFWVLLGMGLSANYQLRHRTK